MLLYSTKSVPKYCYSYLKASIGSKFEAFLAGYQPKNTPIIVQIENDNMMGYSCIDTEI